MARHPNPLPSSLGPVFTWEEARAAGVSTGRLRARDVAHPHRGLLVTPASASRGDGRDDNADPFATDRARRAELWDRARLYGRLMVAHAFFAGRTAAALWGMPVDPSGPLEVAVPSPHRAPRRHGIRSRQVSQDLVAVVEVEGVRASDPASTWGLLAAEMSVRELVRIGDAIVREPRGPGGFRHPGGALASIDDLQRATDAGRRRGIARMRAALPLIRVGSASPLETDFRLLAEQEGLPESSLDVEIRDDWGRLLGITEIAYRDFRVLVEIEGDHHRTSRRQWNRDIEKYAAYVAEGYEVVRLTAAHIRGAEPVAARIVREVLLRRGWRP
ncbi:hypothetical protein AUC47_16030 [Microbacterium sp. SZ1]|uniref:hypothetical protein n=1 Tax=Microbacterium sp. SZ1 TaxID=1849736 RepID=UPI000BBC61D5|nr:hypothetical protein [Microbacterium sp. SZ1]PCE14665.1 hypothetical protein AUC47_16030 [Microbacterium sp. SZ1]